MSRFHYLNAPAYRLLDLACRVVRAAWPEYGPYLVGSATQRPDYRDVDVRVILTDADWQAMFGLDPAAEHLADTRYVLVCSLVSEYLARSTRLPVDLQSQSQTQAARYDGVRLPLGFNPQPTKEQQ